MSRDHVGSIACNPNKNVVQNIRATISKLQKNIKNISQSFDTTTIIRLTKLQCRGINIGDFHTNTIIIYDCSLHLGDMILDRMETMFRVHVRVHL